MTCNGTKKGPICSLYQYGDYEYKYCYLTNCYYNNEKFTLETETTSTGLSTEQFASENNFSGWGFTNTWIIKDGVPELRIFVKDE